MLYVQQSFGANEEIVRVAHFHWFYTLQEVMWVAIGFICAIGIMIIMTNLEISHQVSYYYPDIPPELAAEARSNVLRENGNYLSVMFSLHPAIKLSALAVFIIGLFLFAKMMVVKATTEICVTNNRVIYKVGLVARYTGEMGIDRVESVNIYQGVLGRIFGFGRVSVHGMGVGEIVLPTIAEPLEFRKAIDHAKTV